MWLKNHKTKLNQQGKKKTICVVVGTSYAALRVSGTTPNQAAWFNAQAKDVKLLWFYRAAGPIGNPTVPSWGEPLGPCSAGNRTGSCTNTTCSLCYLPLFHVSFFRQSLQVLATTPYAHPPTPDRTEARVSGLTLHAAVGILHLLRQGDHKRLLEVAGVHEGDWLDHHWLYDRQDSRAPNSMPRECRSHHWRHGQWHPKGLHSRGRR